MHSLNHPAYAHAVVADRLRAAPRGVARTRRHRPPPVRGHVAYAVARVAGRLGGRGSKSARRALV